MYSFYPGPSEVSEKLPQYFEDAFKEGVMTMNHRSDEFVAISTKVVKLLKEKLNVPEDYGVYFTSSATECWEIIAQSLITKSSTHVYNGAFGKKWKDNTEKLGKETYSFEFEINQEFELEKASIPKNSEIICLCQNETSNGTQISNEKIKELKLNYPDSLIAVDATSSMGGIDLHFENADVWFASVQKCFGLPAGLGLLICSPKAIGRALVINENSHYNSLLFMHEKMNDFQTTYTPNVLGIYFLMRVLNDREKIEIIEKKIKNRYENWTNFLKKFKYFSFLISNPKVRSLTVLPLKMNEKDLNIMQDKAKSNDFLLGKGYGKWKNDTFRIANFPSINSGAIIKLQAFLSTNFNK